MLKRRRKPRMGTREPDGGRVRCPAHLQWVRGHECAIKDRWGEALGRGGLIHVRHECEGPIEAAHVRTGTDGAAGVKPSDCHTIPLCEIHHLHQHTIGERKFEALYGIDMKKIAEDLWRRSPARLKWEREKETT